MCCLAPASHSHACFFLVQVVVSELTHQLKPPHAHKFTDTSAQGRPTPTQRGCTWLRGPDFARDGHVTLVTHPHVMHPHVRLQKYWTCKVIIGEKPCEARECRSRGSNSRPASGLGPRPVSYHSGSSLLFFLVQFLES